MSIGNHNTGTMLIAIAHGSRNPAWQASVERQFEMVQKAVGASAVQLAYMDLSSPTLAEATETAVRIGIIKIRVLPLFLAADGHVMKDVEPLVDKVRKDFPSIEVELLPPMGQLPQFVELLKSLVEEEAS